MAPLRGQRNHGLTGYNKHGCRCPVCLAAAVARSEWCKADRKARPEFYKEKGRLDRERNGEKQRARANAKTARLAAERKVLREATRPEREAAARQRNSEKAKAAYAAKKLSDPYFAEKNRLASMKWLNNNREKSKARKRAYYKKNQAKMIAERKAYAKAHPEVKRQTRRNRQKNDPCFRMLSNLRKRMRDLLEPMRRTCPKQHKLIGCTRAELRNHLLSLFLPGMSWDNYGTAWHVDHIRPCASFDLSDPEQQRQCFHFSNLQPLWDEINQDKSDSLWTPDVMSYAVAMTPYPA